MDKWFKSKWFVRGFSLALAILLYVFVSIDMADNTDNDNPRIPGNNSQIEIVENVPVDIRMNSDQYVVSGVPEFVSVQLEGSSSILVVTARQKNFDVYVDLEDLDVGEHTVEIQTEDVPNELTATVDPRFIDITIEERATDEYDVGVDFINQDQLPEGFEVGNIEVSPEIVTVTSSKSMMERVGMIKVFVDLTDVTASISDQELPVNVYDSQGNELQVRVEPEVVSVSVEINNPSKVVPITIPTTGTLPEGFSLTSLETEIEEVEIFAITNILEGIDEIETEPIDLSNISESGTVTVPLDLPDRVQAPDLQTIEVTIELEQTRTFDDILIDVENLGDGQEVSFIEPEGQALSITVTGNEQDVNELTTEDIIAFIDLEGLDEGEHQVPVHIEVSENFDVEMDIDEVTIELSIES